MTAQAPDFIRFEPDGRRHLLCTNPLEDWLWQHGLGCYQTGRRGMNTANWRGYEATFLVHDGHLWLEEIEAVSGAAVTAPKRRQRIVPDPDQPDGSRWEMEDEAAFKQRKAADAADPNRERRLFTPEGLFPEREGAIRDGERRVRADWYSGELRIPIGARIKHVHGGYGSTWERDRLVMIEKGVVVRDWVRENR